MRIAITRKVSPAIGNCELTHLPRLQIDLALAEQQHCAYENCLESLGCRIHSLPSEPALPDSVFVEDAAIVFPELAVITRPGAESRRAETASIAAALQPYRPLQFITAPATVDGGDVLRIGKKVFVGQSTRTNNHALEQLCAIVGPLGYDVLGVHVARCLHLKSAVTQVSEDSVLINPNWVDADVFRPLHSIRAAPTEPFAANALLVGQTVIYPSAFPETRRRLKEHDMPLAVIDVSELAKAEGAVTCCSLIVEGYCLGAL
jgi:dimethylargininase